jgi:hypothetical protein
MSDDKASPGSRPQRELKIELGEKEAEGIYANLALITHSPAEFILDFCRLLPGAPKTRVQARVVMAPRNVKRFLAALEENLKRYEERHGTLPVDEDPHPPAKDIGFTSR